MKKQGYEINHINNTITFTAMFAKKMGTINNEEYNTFLTLRKDFPNYAIKVEEDTKKTYAKLTIAKMTDIIKKYDANSAKTLVEFEYIQACGELRGAKYPIAKKWFLERYAELLEQYEIEEKKTEDPKTASKKSALEAFEAYKPLKKSA